MMTMRASKLQSPIMLRVCGKVSRISSVSGLQVIHELWTPAGGAYNVDGVLRVPSVDDCILFWLVSMCKHSS